VTGLKVRGQLGIEIGHALFRTTTALAPRDDAEQEELTDAADSEEDEDEEGEEEKEEEEEEEKEEEEGLGLAADCWIQLRHDDSKGSVLDLTQRRWVRGRLFLDSWDEMRLVSEEGRVEIELERVLPLDI
jgi:hypothetical protein